MSPVRGFKPEGEGESLLPRFSRHADTTLSACSLDLITFLTGGHEHPAPPTLEGRKVRSVRTQMILTPGPRTRRLRPAPQTWARRLAVGGVLTFLTAWPSGGLVTAAQDLPAASQPADSLISLNFPENIDLKTIIDYVSERLNLNIIYQDDQLSNQRVTLKSPTKLPVSALRGLLDTLLKVKGFALVDSDQPGWKRVVALQSSSVPATQPGAANRVEQVVTQAFTLKFVDPQRAEQAVKPFLSGPTAGTLGIPEQHVLLVTDFESSLRRARDVIDLIDQPNRNIRVDFIPVKNADAAQLSQQVKQILLARLKAQLLPGQNPDSSLEVTQDRRTGQLVVVGPAALVEEASSIVKSLDTPVSEQQSPIRFYKLANATASDVLETIRALEGDSSSGDSPPAPAPRAAPTQAPSPAAAPGTGGFGVGSTGGFGGGGLGGASASPGLNNPYGTGGLGGAAGAPPTGNFQPNVTSSTPPPAPAGLRTKNATVASDPNTNSIIVIAEPSIQKLYEQLITALDKRRPQVLLEATIVTVDTSHNLTLGVEVSLSTKPGGSQAFGFSSFGFSTADPTTGRLSLTPGVGFNGVVIGSDVAQVILRALAQNNRAKVMSAPRILVNDNATGTLASLTEQPYTTTAIGTTIATTTFGGYAQAGTTITLTPHISESDYLQLEYQVSLSSFVGSQTTSSAGIPPGIEQDSVQSKVTIPDGSTVVVGGLNRSNFSKTVNAVPILGQIPILKYLFSSQNDTNEQLTLFVFLRPVILRDDQFADLKFLSDRDLKDAGLPPGMPDSAPLPIR